MSATDMVRQWQETVKLNLLPALHAHQAKALALFSWTMALAGRCGAGPVASLAPAGAAKPASVRRRMERLLANERLDGVAAMLQLARSVMRDWGGCPGRKLLLILDETPRGNALRCMRLSVAYRKRTVTLLSVCYPPNRPPMPMPKLVRWMLRQVAASCLPDGVTITLLADRGLCWPTVIRQCRRLGWHYLLRLQGDTRVRLGDGTVKAVGELARRRGTRWFGTDVRVFKKARWLKANVVAVWEPPCKEPWLAVQGAVAPGQRHGRRLRVLPQLLQAYVVRAVPPRREESRAELAAQPGERSGSRPAAGAVDGAGDVAVYRDRRRGDQTGAPPPLVRTAAASPEQRLPVGQALSGVRRDS